MTVLTVLQEQLAEAHGFAIAATTLTQKVEQLTADAALRRELAAMREDARETRARCLELEAALADELRAHAVTASERASDLAGAWFKAGTGQLAAWTFLAMSEAGEVAVWTTIARLAQTAADPRFLELVGWSLPVQQRHLQAALDGAARIAALADPAAPRWG